MKEFEITIDNWQKGIAQSPYLGFEELFCVDIDSKPGVLQAGFKSTKQSGTTFSSTVYPIKMVEYGGNYYAITNPGYSKVYKYTSTGNPPAWAELTGYTSSINYQDLIIWKGYLLLIRSTKIDVYDIAATQGWTNNYKASAVSISSGGSTTPANTNLKAFIGSDDKVYITNGRFVEILSENAGSTLDFDDAATFTIATTTSGLDLPVGFTITHIEEVNSFLLITAYNTSNQIYIFKWDKTSTSFNNALPTGLTQVHATISVNNLMYIIADPEGAIYVTDGLNIRLVSRIPDNITGVSRVVNPIVVYREAICFLNNKIYFALSSHYSGTETNKGQIISFNIGDQSYRQEHIMSDGLTGDTSNYLLFFQLLASSIPTSTKVTLVWLYAYAYGTGSYGVDYASASARYVTSYGVSSFYPCGTKMQKHTFKSLECQLTKPFITGESIAIYYRTYQNGSWTQIGSTWSYSGTATGTDNQSWETSFGATAENIQFKVVITTAGNTRYSPEILYIRAK